MASVSQNKAGSQTDLEHGIELKEVDFKEFDRRKAPRISSYDLFLKSLESSSIEMEFIV